MTHRCVHATKLGKRKALACGAKSVLASEESYFQVGFDEDYSQRRPAAKPTDSFAFSEFSEEELVRGEGGLTVRTFKVRRGK